MRFSDELTSSDAVFAGWAGLVINGLNLIPIGELDGGRILHGIWGRRAATRVGVVVTLVLGLAGFIDSLALYWCAQYCPAMLQCILCSPRQR